MPPKKRQAKKQTKRKPEATALPFSPYAVAMGNLGRVDEKKQFLLGRIYEHKKAQASPGFQFETSLLDAKGESKGPPSRAPNPTSIYANLQTAKAVYGKVNAFGHPINFNEALPAFEALLVGDNITLDVSAGTSGAIAMARAVRIKATRLAPR